MKKLFLFIVILISGSGCFHNYFKVKKNDNWSTDEFRTLYDSKKKFIIHYDDATMEMTEPVVSQDQVTGTVKKYSPLRANYENPDPTDKTHQYKHKHRDELFSEVHVYVNGPYPGGGTATVNAGNFKDMRIYEPNSGATFGSYALGVFVVVMGVLTVAAIAAAATTAVVCNCPQVYIEASPQQYEFVAGMYSGAIMSTLERTDQLVLNSFDNKSDTLRLLVRGYPGETQYMNQAVVKRVAHPEKTELVVDQLGQLYAVKKLDKPEKIYYSNVTERGQTVAFKDGETFNFQFADTNTNSSSIVLQYKKNKDRKEALLVARLKNSAWGGYVYHDFIGLYGNAYSTWISRQEQSNNKPQEWQKAQGLMLKVQVKTKNGWQTVDYFPAAGNTASRDMAMKIDLTNIEGDDVQVRLESAFRFWELDYAALSNSYDPPLSVSDMTQMKAVLKNNDQTGSLQENDGHYVVLEDKDSLALSFYPGKLDSSPGVTNTYVLVARGYYHQKNKNDDPPRVELLRSFMNPGAFHKYSLEKFNQMALKMQEANIKP